MSNSEHKIPRRNFLKLLSAAATAAMTGGGSEIANFLAASETILPKATPQIANALHMLASNCGSLSGGMSPDSTGFTATLANFLEEEDPSRTAEDFEQLAKANAKRIYQSASNYSGALKLLHASAGEVRQLREAVESSIVQSQLVSSPAYWRTTRAALSQWLSDPAMSDKERKTLLDEHMSRGSHVLSIYTRKNPAAEKINSADALETLKKMASFTPGSKEEWSLAKGMAHDVFNFMCSWSSSGDGARSYPAFKGARPAYAQQFEETYGEVSEEHGESVMSLLKNFGLVSPELDYVAWRRPAIFAEDRTSKLFEDKPENVMAAVEQRLAEFPRILQENLEHHRKYCGDRADFQRIEKALPDLTKRWPKITEEIKTEITGKHAKRELARRENPAWPVQGNDIY